MSTPAFGLYSATAMAAGQRVQAGHTLLLNEPVLSAGVTLFRRSLWLPVPAGLATAQALRLSSGNLQLRFSPLRFSVGTDNMQWFPALQHLSAQEVRLEMAWPAPVVAVAKVSGRRAHEVDLLRADGDAVAEEATVSGFTGSDLPEPFVGTPLVVRLGNQVFDVAGKNAQANLRAAPVSAGGAGATGAAGVIVMVETTIAYRLASSLVPALTLAGRPTTPRLRLVAEQSTGETLLWQALLPGEQATVSLPTQPVTPEWAPALEQLRALCAKPASTPLRLRLDVESDAPCQVNVQAASFALQADFELLQDGPMQLSFDGQQVQARPLPLVLPGGSVAAGLSLAGRVVADAASDAGYSAPANGRIGALMSSGDTAVQPVQLPGPMAVAGVVLAWQPLSSDVKITVRLHADGGSGPSPQVLAQHSLQATTPQATALAFRWPSLDLQAQRVWLRISVDDGAGLCPFDAAASPGWVESAASAAPVALPQGLSAKPSPAPPEDLPDVPPARAIGLSLGAQTLATSLPAAALALDVPTTLLPLLASHPLTFTSGVRGSVTIESARLKLAL